jgi:uncharacterized coiled-coil protein SlyX
VAAWWMRGGAMPTLEERVAFLEGTVAENRGVMTELRDAIKSMDRRLDTKIDRLDTTIDRLDSKVDRQFLWCVGIQITVLLAVIGTLLRTYSH